MSNIPNVEPTAKLIEEMATAMESRARELRRSATSLRESQNLEIAGDVANLITNLFIQLRIDLLVIRPIRAYWQMDLDRARTAEKKSD